MTKKVYRCSRRTLSLTYNENRGGASPPLFIYFLCKETYFWIAFLPSLMTTPL